MNVEQNILAYHGPISIDLVSTMATFVKERVRESTKITSRLYKVFIELAQNVSYYSAESLEKNKTGFGIGWVSVDGFNDCFTITTSNLIAIEHGPTLKKNCDEINALTESQLRILKRKTRSEACVRDIGAHIGLIQTGMISGNDLMVTIDIVDEKHALFTLKVKIDTI